MKSMCLGLAIGVLAATILSGCVVAVDERRHDEGRYERERGGEGGGYAQYHSSLYRPYDHEDR